MKKLLTEFAVDVMLLSVLSMQSNVSTRAHIFDSACLQERNCMSYSKVCSIVCWSTRFWLLLGFLVVVFQCSSEHEKSITQCLYSGFVVCRYPVRSLASQPPAKPELATSAEKKNEIQLIT